MQLPSETLRLAFRLLWRRPGRSGLTMLGLAIGVGAFIAMLSFGEGAKRSVISQFELLGVNLIKIQASAPPLGPNNRAPAPLDDQDVALLRREATTLQRVSPVGRRTAAVARGAEQRSTTVYGVDAGYLAFHGWPIELGGGLTDDDVVGTAKLCVIGQTIASSLFADREPLGDTLLVAGMLPCRVVGVLSQRGYSTSGNDLDDVVMLPITTFQAQLADSVGYAYLEAEPHTGRDPTASFSELDALLRRAHGLQPGQAADFGVSSPQEVIRAAARTARILTTLLAAIAAVSLLVGGIGIMNIQLVSVAERTEEIGIRSAIGASPRQILGQFLTEALVLSLLGTLLGVLAGIGVASLVAERMAWPRVISPTGVALAAAFGAATGILFGYLPAQRAANLEPIDALRHE